MIIDTHTHIFADAIAKRARESLVKTAGVPCYTDMTENSTRQYLKDNGIDFAVMAPIATKPSQQDTINDWAASVDHGSIISFGTIYPGAGDPKDQVRGITERGLHGVKLHPDYQHFFADDPALYPLYEAISDAGLPLLFHAGRDPISMNVVHCTPLMLLRLSEIFPDLRIMGAHLGGNMMYDAVERDLVGTNVFLDLSMSLIYCDPAQIERIIRMHRAERILFATDTPWSEPKPLIAFIENLDIPEDDKERILWKNAAKLLGLDDAFFATREAEKGLQSLRDC